MAVLCSAALAQRRPAMPPDLPVSPADLERSEKPVVLKMRVEEGRVTAEIADCPLQNALTELAERTGIIFEVRSQHNPPVSVYLDRVPLAEAIQRIASDSNVMFLYAPGGPGAESISLVRIFPREREPAQPGILYLGTGAVTKRGSPEGASQETSADAPK
jgi:hypothetical protein